MKRVKFIAAISPLLLGVVPLILALSYRSISPSVPKEFLGQINYLSIIVAVSILIGWLMSLLILVKGYNKDNFDKIQTQFDNSAKKIQRMLHHVHITSVHEWIVTDDKLDVEYESKVGIGKAIVVVTPTLRNDCDTGENTTGTDFLCNVTRNLGKGVRYRYIMPRNVAEKHFSDLITYHRKTSTIEPDDIKAIVTTMPLVTEMVYYPLEEPAAFTIFNTDTVPGVDIAEYNVKMVKKEEFSRFKELVKHIYNSTDTKIWFSNSTGEITSREINQADRQDFFNLTGLSVWKT
jgi:hypothetical protein